MNYFIKFLYLLFDVLTPGKKFELFGQVKVILFLVTRL